MDSDCVRSGELGQCVFPEARCAFDDDACDSGLRWDDTAGDRGGTCVAVNGTADAGSDGGLFPNACGGTNPLPGVPGEPCGACDVGQWMCDGTEAVDCVGEPTLSVPIAFEGAVSASTEFDASFRAELSVDGDFSTSWFSSGPEAGGVPSVYSWVGSQPDCIDTVSIVGNGQHADPDFQEMFGFGQVTVQVYDAANDLVFSETVMLPGTPDPDADVSPAVVGKRIDLLFLGHESPDCGGYGELLINALR